MKKGAPELLSWIFATVATLYMLGNTKNPIGYISIVISTTLIYKLLKKEEARQNVTG